MRLLCKDTNAGRSTKLTLCAHLVRLLHLNSFRCPAPGGNPLEWVNGGESARGVGWGPPLSQVAPRRFLAIRRRNPT